MYDPHSALWACLAWDELLLVASLLLFRLGRAR